MGQLWVEELQQYNLKTSHIPGKENAAADALSRRPGEVEIEEIQLRDTRKKRRQVPREQFSPLLIPLVDANDWRSDDFRDPYLQDPESEELCEPLRYREWRSYRHYTNFLSE